MRQDLELALYDKYPEIFKDYENPECKYSIRYGIQCGDGWYNLIDYLCSTITSHLKSHSSYIKQTKEWNAKVADPNYEWPKFAEPVYRLVPDLIPPVVVAQIKEKFGGLRFYYDGGDDFIRGAVQLAETLSTKTCETCGNPGELISNQGWWYTSCDKHLR